MPVGAVPAPPGRMEGALEGDAGAEGFRGSCRAGLEAVPLTAVRLELEVRSCRAMPECVHSTEGAAVAGGIFLPGRDAGSGGL